MNGTFVFSLSTQIMEKTNVVLIKSWFYCNHSEKRTSELQITAISLIFKWNAYLAKIVEAVFHNG